MTAPLIIRQPALGEDLERVTAELLRAFVLMRDAVAAGRPVVVCIDDRDLLGQGTPPDAAVATALLGLVRAFAIEGAREGWQVNAVTHRGDEASVDELSRRVCEIPGLTGQLLRAGTEHLGKVVP